MTGDTLVQSHAMAKSLAKRFAEEAPAPASDLREAVALSATEADEELCVMPTQSMTFWPDQRDGKFK
jgi:hypothetical protein